MRGYIFVQPSSLNIIYLVFCLLSSSSVAHILVYRKSFNQLIEEFNDLPATFGAVIPSIGLKVFACPASPKYGCGDLNGPPSRDYPQFSKFVAIIERGGDCNFENKVRNAQKAQFDAVIVYNNKGDDLEQMSAKNSTGILIPSVFVGHTTGISLNSFKSTEYILVINDELPFNINTQLILPFCILIGICFLIMLFYMIYKCIREQRRLRRHRLPKRLLKKLPILKYSKNNDLCYDTCVICLDEFVEGDKLRVLPCRHPYHTQCIDPWLTENRRVCPICKRKVFTKGEARSLRNRQSSLDSMTDTDDDTTPLLHQPTDNPTGSGRLMPESGNLVATTIRDSTTHGTFNRNDTDAPQVYEVSSDEENVLGIVQAMGNNQRINPFDRRLNLPPNQNTERSDNSLSIWARCKRLFNFQQISISAPPFIEEVPVINDGHLRNNTTNLPDSGLGQSHGQTTERPPQCSNIINDNVEDSFKVNDESPPHTIYEPIEQFANNADPEQYLSRYDSAFLDESIPHQDTSVATLPNSTLSSDTSGNRPTDRRNYILF